MRARRHRPFRTPDATAVASKLSQDGNAFRKNREYLRERGVTRELEIKWKALHGGAVSNGTIYSKNLRRADLTTENL